MQGCGGIYALALLLACVTWLLGTAVQGVVFGMGFPLPFAELLCSLVPRCHSLVLFLPSQVFQGKGREPLQIPMLLEVLLVPLLVCRTQYHPSHPHSSPWVRRMRMTGSHRWGQLSVRLLN